MVLGGDNPCWLEAHVNWQLYIKFKYISKEELKIGTHPGLPLRTVIATAPFDPNIQTLNAYTDASCRQNTGFGIVAALNDEVVKVRLYLDTRLDVIRAEAIAVAIAIQKCKNMRCNVLIHTDNKKIADNFAKRKVQNNIGAEM